MGPEDPDVAIKESENLHEREIWEEAWDDVAGKSLRLDLVRQAGKDELDYFHKMKVHTKVHIQERLGVTTK